MLTDNQKRFLWVLDELTKRLNVEAVSLTIVDRNATHYIDCEWEDGTYLPIFTYFDRVLSAKERKAADTALRSLGQLPFYSTPTIEDYERKCGIA